MPFCEHTLSALSSYHGESIYFLRVRIRPKGSIFHGGAGHLAADANAFAKVSIAKKGKSLLAKDIQI